MKPVTVTVPATSANLGPGFDCLAVAVGLFNQVTFQPRSEGWRVQVEGEGSASLPANEDNLTLQAAFKVFDQVGRRPSGLLVRAHNQIPLASGLGSSAAAVVAGLAAANAMVQAELSKDALLEFACDFEGPADNAAAALYGGLNVVARDGAGVLSRRLPIAHLQLVIVVPALPLSTDRMRRILPRTVPLRDAVFNLPRTAMMVEALRTGDYDLLGRALQDRLHQPYRSRFLPGFEEVVAAARDQGAVGVALSGAGPGVMAFTPENHAAVGTAMVAAFAAAGVQARALVVPIDRRGVRISPAE